MTTKNKLSIATAKTEDEEQTIATAKTDGEEQTTATAKTEEEAKKRSEVSLAGGG